MTMVKNIFPLILTTLRLVKTLHENLKKKLSYHAYEQEKSRPQKISFPATRRWNGTEPSVIET